MVTVPHTPRSTTVVPTVASVGPFAVGFRLFDSDGLAVYVDGVPTTAFAVRATFTDGYDDNAYILLVEQIPSGATLRIDGSMLPQRSASYIPTDPSILQKINVELARAWATLTEQYRDNQRSLRIDRPVAPWCPSVGRVPLWDGEGFIDGPNAADIAGSQAAAARAEAAAVIATEMAGSANGTPNYATRAAASVATVPALAQQIIVEGAVYRRDEAGTALTTGDGVKWAPVSDRTPKTFGAAGDGVADDAVAFQSLIDSLPATPGPHVINVPAGSYAGDMAALSLGGRNIIWQQSGPVTYPGTQPVGWGANRPWLGDTRPWSVGGVGFARDTGTGTPRATVDVRRNTDHTGGGAGQVHSGLNVQSNVLTSVGNFENALTAVLEDRVPQLSAANFCAFQGEVRRKADAAGSLGTLFGANILAKDETVLDSAASGGGLVGLELNVAARGLDNGNKRIVLDLIPKCFGQTGTMEAYAGLRLKNSTSGGTTTLKRGISIEAGGGSINRGVHIEADQEAIYVAGAPAAVLDSQVSNAALVRMGSTRSANGDLLGTAAFSGWNAAAARVSYGTITGSIVNGATGSESGSLSLNIMIGGTLSAGIAVNGASPANPISLRIDGAMKSVTQGAVDSGGAGFRALRVPN